jgi:hypothetical protein
MKRHGKTLRYILAGVRGRRDSLRDLMDHIDYTGINIDYYRGRLEAFETIMIDLEREIDNA